MLYAVLACVTMLIENAKYFQLKPGAAKVERNFFVLGSDINLSITYRCHAKLSEPELLLNLIDLQTFLVLISSF